VFEKRKQNKEENPLLALEECEQAHMDFASQNKED